MLPTLRSTDNERFSSIDPDCMLPSMVEEFAERWIADWNSLDIDQILGHYGEEIVFTSPKALARLPHTLGTVRGLEELREYWEPLPLLRPNLKFTLETVLSTVNGCTLLYRDEYGMLVAETMLFDADGAVIRGIVSHALH